jgi:hypothetical protein
MDRVFAESLVHEIGVAAREIGTKDGPLAEAERFDEQGETDSDLFASGPGRDVQRLPLETGDPVDGVLRRSRRGRWAASKITSPVKQPQAFRFIGALSRCCGWERFLRRT